MQLTAEEVERGYNNRVAVPSHPEWFARWAVLSDAAREALHPRLDLRYGPHLKETLDLFLPAGPVRGTLLFIHGGYWRTLDKADHAFVAPPFVQAGMAVAVMNYDLCPTVSIATILDECRRAVTWLVHDGPAHGLGAAPIVVGGHSAGGHLAAMLHATDWTRLGLARHPVAGGVSLSGVHDLSPLIRFSFNTDLRLDDAEAARLSPIHLQPTTPAPFLIAVGADETSEFRRQTQLLWEAWPSHRPPGATCYLSIPQRHHFSVVADYADPASAITRQTLALFPR
ncbi:MAG: alpha/beta hydrolase [Betaproteobacteria bacterium]